MKNKKLEELCNTYKDKSNKDLAKILVTLNNDFETIKKVLFDLSVSIGEIEQTYDKIYVELQNRLKFKENG
jgi:hypothetical protein